MPQHLPTDTGGVSHASADVPTRQSASTNLAPRVDISGAARLSNAELVQEVRSKVIVPNRHFHGTDATGQESIRTHGFRSELKQEGGGGGDEVCPEHYLTESKRQAELYGMGRAATSGDVGSARLVRTIGVRDLPGVDHEEQGGGALTSVDDISIAHVFPSKREPMSRETAQIVQGYIARDLGLQVTVDRARQLGDEARSDSEDDFPGLRR